MRRSRVTNSRYLRNIKVYLGGGTSGDVTPDNGDTGLNTIIRISMAPDCAVSDVADLTVARCLLGGRVGTTAFGLFYGGASASSYSNVIDKFTYSTEANAVDYGDLSSAYDLGSMSGASNDTTGIFWENTTDNTTQKATTYKSLASSGNVSATGDSSSIVSTGVEYSTSLCFSNSTTNYMLSKSENTGNSWLSSIAYATVSSTTLVGNLGSGNTGSLFNQTATMSDNYNGYKVGDVASGVSRGVRRLIISSLTLEATVISELGSNTRFKAGGDNGYNRGYAIGGSSTLIYYQNIDSYAFRTNAYISSIGDLGLDRSGAATNMTNHSGLVA